jgi:hypothetical protein
MIVALLLLILLALIDVRILLIGLGLAAMAAIWGGAALLIMASH